MQSNLLEIDATTGQISLKHSLDYEEGFHFYFPVSVSNRNDSSKRYVNITINVIDVNDNPPVFEKDAYRHSPKKLKFFKVFLEN